MYTRPVIGPSFDIGGSVLPIVDHVKDLGVLVDDCLKFHLHVNHISSSLMRERAHHDSSWQKKQRGSETKTYILTKTVGMAYGDNGPLFTKLLGGT